MLENDGSVSTQIRREKLRPIVLWAATTLICYLCSVIVDHVSDDWYFVLAAGTNLANGFDLSFTPDERVNAFTSPLNTLLTSLLVAIAGADQPTTALWLHRLLAASSLGGAVIALNSIARRYCFPTWSSALLGFALMLDGRVLTGITSGSANGFVILLLAMTVRIHTIPHYRPATWFGVTAGLLFLAQPIVASLIPIVSVAFLIFMPGAALGINRGAVLRTQIRAGLIAAIVAGPWLVWALFNLGSALPLAETTALGHQLSGINLTTLLQRTITFPLDCLAGGMNLDHLFGPLSAFADDNWPPHAVILGRIFGCVTCFYWLNPFASRFGRSVSLSVCVALFLATQFLTDLPASLFVALLVIAWISLATVFSDGLKLAPRQSETPASRSWRTTMHGAIAIVVILSIVGSAVTARGLQTRQYFINQGTLNAVGHWLNDNSNARETVFLPQSGVVGYLSKLNLHDYPGMSSWQTVINRERLTEELGHFGEWQDLTPAQIVALGRELEPDWIVIRPSTAVRLHLYDPTFLGGYEQAAIFSRRTEIENADWIPGRGELIRDASRIIYRRLPERNESQSSAE